VEESLRRLGRETIDLYQIHWPQPDALLEEAWAELTALAAAGKIRAAGICNSTPQQIARLQDGVPVASLQVPASMFSSNALDAAGSWCAERGIACIAYGILEKGLLAGGFTQERICRLPMDDHRKRDPAFTGARLSAALQFVAAVAPVAQRTGMTCAQLALSWALHEPRLSLALVGTRSAAQVDELLDRADTPLPADVRDAIAACRSQQQKP
jgi:aryl-alcohol dehydrogenase-like predicted oxidoreductase